MKNIFNGKRFIALLKKDAHDLHNQYLKLILIMACAFLVPFILLAFSENSSFMDYAKIRYSISGVCLWGTILLAPFQLYKRYNHKIYGVNYFMLPASQAEKWLSMFFYCVIATPVVVILSITLIDLCLYPFFPWGEKTLWITFSEVSAYNYFNSKNFLEALILYFVFQSLLFLGNIWFQRAKIQKTVVAIIILLFAHMIFILFLVKVFGVPGTSIDINGFGVISFNKAMNMSYNKAKNMLGFSEIWSIINMMISYLIAPIGLWVVSFMKMKEQQL